MSERVLERGQFFPESVERVFAPFADAGNLQAITPPWLHFRIISELPIEMKAGAIIEYRLRFHGVPGRWRTVIESWDPPTASPMFSSVGHSRSGTTPTPSSPSKAAPWRGTAYATGSDSGRLTMGRTRYSSAATSHVSSTSAGPPCSTWSQYRLMVIRKPQATDFRLTHGPLRNHRHPASQAIGAIKELRSHSGLPCPQCSSSWACSFARPGAAAVAVAIHPCTTGLDDNNQLHVHVRAASRNVTGQP